RHLAAGRAGNPRRHLDRLRQCDRALRLAGYHRPAGADFYPADAHLRALQLPAAIWARLGAVADLCCADRGGALAPARLSRAALLRHPLGKRLAAAAFVFGTVALAALRLLRSRLPRRNPSALRLAACR